MKAFTPDQIKRPFSWTASCAGQTRHGYCATEEQAQNLCKVAVAELKPFGTVSSSVGKRQSWEH